MSRGTTDKKVIEFALSDLLSIASFQEGERIESYDRYRLEEIVEFLAVQVQVKPENIEGWQKIEYESEEVLT